MAFYEPWNENRARAIITGFAATQGRLSADFA
jgi:hypothetical protein